MYYDLGVESRTCGLPMSFVAGLLLIHNTVQQPTNAGTNDVQDLAAVDPSNI